MTVIDLDSIFSEKKSTVDLESIFAPEIVSNLKKENNSGPIDSFSSGWMSGIGQQGQRNAWDQYSNFVNARPSAVKREAGLRDIEALGVSPDSLDYHKPETVDGDNLWDGRATMPTFQEFITMPEDQIPASLREARRNFTEGHQQQQKYQTDYHWQPGERTNFIGHSLGQAGPDMVDALTFAGLTGGVSSGIGLTGALSSGAARGVAAVGGGPKLQALAGMAAGSAPAGIAASSIESNAEGYGAYQEAIAQNRSHDEAMEIANSVIAKNYMVNPVTNTLEFATTFGPVKLKGTGPLWKLLKVGGGVAMNAAFGAGEEGAQEIIKRDALDQPIELDQEMIDNLVAGGVMGGGFHAAGRAATSIINHPIDIDALDFSFQAEPEGQLSYMKDSPGGLDSFVDAISNQESGGNYDALNPHTGASGRFQIMPENWPSWAENAGLGSDAPRTPENQDLVAQHKMQEYYNEFGNWLDVAIAWYAGPGAVKWSQEALNRPQYEYDEAGNVTAEYPSINSYAASVVGKMGGAGRGQSGRSSSGQKSTLPNIPTAPDPFAEGIGEIKTIAKPEDVRDRIGRVVDGDKSINYKMPVRKVTETEAALVKELVGVDISGYTHKIDMNSIRHSMKRHGEGRENAPDQVGMTKEDYQYIPDVINSPDRIIAGNDSKTKQKTLRYEKNIGGQIIVVEEVLPMNKTLITKTAYKKSLSQALTDENISRGHTSETVDNATSFTPSNSNIDQNPDSGKSYMAAPMMGGIYDGMHYGDGRSDGRTTTKNQILEKVHQIADIPVRYGRLGKRGIRGFFNGKAGVIRIGKRFDFDTIFHELGHGIDNGLGGLSKDPKHATEFSSWVTKQFGKAYSPEQHSSEGVAEFMRQFLTDRNAAAKNFPGFYKDFLSTLDKNPPVKKALNEMTDLMKVWRSMSPEQRVQGGMSFKEEGTLKKALKSPIGTLKKGLNWAEDHFIDSFSPIFRMEKDVVKGLGVNIPDEESPTLLARTYRGVETAAAENILDGYIRKDGSKSASMSEILRLVGKERKAGFESYLVALRELNAYAIERETGEKFGHSVEEKDAEIVARKYENDARFQKARKMVREFNSAGVDLLVDAGIVSQEHADNMKNRWPDYVPFQREEDLNVDDDSLGASFSAGGLARGSTPINKFKGSERNIISPLESMVNNAVVYTARAHANRTMQAIVKIASYNGSAKYVEEVAGTSSPKDKVVPVFFEGEKRYFQLAPDVYSAVSSMKKETAPIWLKAIGLGEVLLRGSATIYNPSFVLTNFPRDTVAAMINATYGFNPRDAMRGMESFIKQDEWFHEWRRNGGGQASIATYQRNEVQTLLNELAGNNWSDRLNLEELKNKITYLNEITEAGVRIGVYRRAIEAGASPIRAAVESRDATVDFARKGLTMASVNTVAAFSNVAVQGTNIVYRVTKKHPLKVAGGVAALTAFSAFLFMSQHDDERYKEVQRREKDRYWIVIPGALTGNKLTAEKLAEEIKAGKTKEQIMSEYGEVYRIPKPQIYGTVFVSTAERLLESFTGNDRATEGMMGSIVEELTPNMVPLILKIPMELASNYSFFRQSPIVSQRFEGKHPVDQFDHRTTEFAKWAGGATGQSPMKIDYAMQSFGGLTNDVIQGVDYLASPENKKPEIPLSRMYGVKRLMVDPLSNTQSIRSFYDDLDEQKKLYSHYQETKEELPGFDRSYLKRLEAQNDQISKLNKIERGILDSETLSSAKKREEIDKLGLRKLKLAQTALAHKKQ